jgi:hypothetical protein
MLYLTLIISLIAICFSLYATFSIPDISTAIKPMEENIKKLEKKIQNMIVDTNDRHEGTSARISKIEKKINK